LFLKLRQSLYNGYWTLKTIANQHAPLGAFLLGHK
jgi:hypothetical protein